MTTPMARAAHVADEDSMTRARLARSAVRLDAIARQRVETSASARAQNRLAGSSGIVPGTPAARNASCEVRGAELAT